MRFISCHNGKLQHLAEVGLKSSGERTFATGLPLVDEMAPGGAFVRGAVHELLSDRIHGQARFFAATLARSASRGMGVSPMHLNCDTGSPPASRDPMPVREPSARAGSPCHDEGSQTPASQPIIW